MSQDFISLESMMAGETLEQFRVEKNMVVFARRFDTDHPEIYYERNPDVLKRVEQTFAKRGNPRDAAMVRTAIQQLANQ